MPKHGFWQRPPHAWELAFEELTSPQPAPPEASMEPHVHEDGCIHDPNWHENPVMPEASTEALEALDILEKSFTGAPVGVQVTRAVVLAAFTEIRAALAQPDHVEGKRVCDVCGRPTGPPICDECSQYTNEKIFADSTQPPTSAQEAVCDECGDALRPFQDGVACLNGYCSTYHTKFQPAEGA